MADELCSKRKNPVTFQPRVDVHSASRLRRLLDPPEITKNLLLSDEDIADCDAEITRLQSQLLYVQEQRKSLINYQTDLRFYLSPFSQFPNEILNTIFEYTCEENLLQEYPWPLSSEGPTTDLILPTITYLPALAISAVCTRWRSLALASPKLWSQLRLEIFSRLTLSVRPELTGFLSTLQLYLDRSADSPLVINLETKDFIDEGDVIPDALYLILEHTHRWKAFYYTGDYDLSCLEGPSEHPSFPILEYLTLQGCNNGMTSGDLQYFEHSPKLRTVKTEYLELMSRLHWYQLTSLDGYAYTEEDLDVLRHCTDLTTLKLRTCAENGAILLPRLNSFVFIRDNVGSLEDAFHIFTFPSLIELIIQSNESSETENIWPADTFSTFISRSSCNLTTLSISGVIISDLDLIAAFRLLPSLNNFTIEDALDIDDENPITSHLISCMHVSSPTPLLPKLRSLSMKINTTSFDDSALVDMVTSRWLPNPSTVSIGIDCLRSLVLHFVEREMTKGPYSSLKRLDAAGMRVVVTGKSTVGC